jgi:Ni,Fe-hydrogenase III component G
MEDESKIQECLENSLPFLQEKITIARRKRITVEVPVDYFRKTIDFLYHELGFISLCTITGLDEKEELEAIYHLSRADGVVLNLKTRVSKEAPTLPSLTDIFPGGANYERELVGLLGFEILNLPPGRQYPLPDDWPKDQHPLRKDWKPAVKV